MLLGKIWCLEQPGNDVHSRAVVIRLKLFFHGDGRARPAFTHSPSPGFSVQPLAGSHRSGPSRVCRGGDRSCQVTHIPPVPWEKQRQLWAKKCTPAISNEPLPLPTPAWLCPVEPDLFSMTNWTGPALLTSPYSLHPQAQCED